LTFRNDMLDIVYRIYSELLLTPGTRAFNFMLAVFNISKLQLPQLLQLSSSVMLLKRRSERYGTVVVSVACLVILDVVFASFVVVDEKWCLGLPAGDLFCCCHFFFVDDVVDVRIYLLIIVVVVIVFVDDVVHVRIYLLVIVFGFNVFVDHVVHVRIYLLVIVVVVIVSVDVVVIVLVAVVGYHAHQVVGSQQHRQKSKGVETTPFSRTIIL
jgi:hypothetical protein